MEFISTIFFLVALLAMLYGLLGVFNPKWLRLTLLTGKSPSRVEALLLAGLLPLPFMFMGVMFYGERGYEGLLSFMIRLVFIVGGIGFYLWGLFGIRNYLQRHQNCNPVVAFLVGAVLSITFVGCFLFVVFAVVTYSDPEVTFAEKMLFSGVGIMVFIIFQQIFRIPFLGYMDWSSSSVDEDNFPEDEMPIPVVGHAAASHTIPVEPRLFSFIYTEDDGQPGRVDALISAAETDNKGRRIFREHVPKPLCFAASGWGVSLVPWSVLPPKSLPESNGKPAWSLNNSLRCNLHNQKPDTQVPGGDQIQN